MHRKRGTAKMRIYDVKINGVCNPRGMDFDQVHVSWKVDETEARKQAKAEIVISDDIRFQHIVVSKEGKELSQVGERIDYDWTPYTVYYVKVSVLADNGEKAESEITYFETAKRAEKWEASFIGTAKEDTFHPVFVKKFSAAKEVQKARIYISGVGLYEAYINGIKAGDDLLAPFINDYHDKLQYQTYDVTEQLQEENECRIFCGNGWYKGRLGYEGHVSYYGERFAAIAEIHIWYKDGTKEIIHTDAAWGYRGSDIECSDIYDGEIINRQLWKTNPNPTRPVEILDGNGNLKKEHLVERCSIPVVVKERRPIQKVITTPAGEMVLDLGQNMTGYLEVKVDAEVLPAGAKMLFEFGEILQQGNFYHDNYRTAKSEFLYISDGREETVRPHFTYFGFRYVKVTITQDEKIIACTIPTTSFTGCVVYSDLEKTVEFASSDAKLNRLAQNCFWGQKSNFLDMPTDCPQRDERLGWTGDAQVFAPTASINMDTRAFYRKFIQDIRADQLKYGGAVAHYFPDIAPQPRGSSVWGDVATFLPMTLYQIYGDRDMLLEHYPMMKDWVDWIIREDDKNGGSNLWDWGFHFGDWLAQDGVTPQSMKGGTDDHFVSACYFYESVKKVAQAAGILGKSEDAQKYHEKCTQIHNAILQEYFTPNGKLAVDSQTAYLLCLRFGIYREKERVIQGLKLRLKKDCYKIKGGFVGATTMCQTLAEHGMEDLAYYILFQEGFPGWMHCINLGATTIWERWNSVLDDGTISGTGMNSLNHYAYGSVMEYVYQYICGVRPLEPGYRRVLIAPQLNSRLQSVQYTFDSCYGKYVSNWEVLENGKVRVHFEIPFGATAKVILPGTNEELELESGVLERLYDSPVDFRQQFNWNSRLEELGDSKEAMEILKEDMPAAYYAVSGGDIELMAMSLEECKYLFFLGFTPEMVEKTAEKLFQIKRGGQKE